MTTEADVPVPVPPAAPIPDRSTRMLGTSLRLLEHGLVVLAVAVLLGVAQTLELWMGAVLVALGLILLAAMAALAGLIGRLRAPRSWWS